MPKDKRHGFGEKKMLNISISNIEKKLKENFEYLDSIQEKNFNKVLESFINNKISKDFFLESTGYGYDDAGRDIIDKVYSEIFHTEDALVRCNFLSGTHAISTAFFANLKPNDELLYVTGMPYDTLHKVIGITPCSGSLADYNIKFDYVNLKKQKVDSYESEIEYFDFDSIKKKINNNTKIVVAQRSKGYSIRHSFSSKEIGELVKFVKNINQNIIVMIDNCYGEFVLESEPSDYGADLLVGSLIKNLGGGLCKSGAYIVGKKDLIENCAYRLTVPGQGKEIGSNFNQNLNILQGLYFAPQIVNNALKSALLLSNVAMELGFEAFPKHFEMQNDIVCAIKLNSSDKLNNFVQLIQKTSPVDSYAMPVASDMPGYDNKIIMACGSFIQGASIELSSDGPMIEPYIAYTQGGLSYFQMKYFCKKWVESLNI